MGRYNERSSGSKAGAAFVGLARPGPARYDKFAAGYSLLASVWNLRCQAVRA